MSQEKKQISHKEAKAYFLNWIDELETKIKQGDPESQKYSEQTAFLHMAVKQIEDRESGLGYME